MKCVLTQADQPSSKMDLHIEHFANITAALMALMHKGQPPPHPVSAFHDLWNHLSTEPIFHEHQPGEYHFILFTDASDKDIGAELSQSTPERQKPVHLSRQITSSEQKYVNIEKEDLAVKWTIEALGY